MRIKLTLLLLLFATACTFQVQVLTTPTPESTEAVLVPYVTATQGASTEVLATTIPTNTPPPLPTLSLPSLTPVPPASLTDQNATPVPIRFSPNGTYVDVIDSILAGRSKTYSIHALKGQIMSISVHQNEQATWTYLIVTVVGGDKKPICATDCQFWRGVLPATQDYLVTLYAPSDALDFTLRVAVDPPGTTTQSFLYENKYRNASFSYTDLFAPTFYPGAQVSRIPPELSLQLIDSDSYINTNLNEAYFLFGSSTDAQILSECTQPLSFGGPETVVGNVTINGVTFTKSQGGGVAAGNIYEQTYYRTVYNGTCYEITYFIHYGNIGAYQPGTVHEFDHDALIQKFNQILNTLTLE
jgi:hypothetical protein